MEKAGRDGLEGSDDTQGHATVSGYARIMEERMLALGSGGNGPWGRCSRWVVHEAPWRTHLCTTT